MGLGDAVKRAVSGWLEIGQVATPSNAPVQTSAPMGPGDGRVELAEIGATGTPIMSGFLREMGEYVPELSWPAAYQVFEQMRRSDAMVATVLQAIKLPIRCAEWRMQLPDDASDVEKQAAEFVQKCLFDEIHFDSVLENALLMLDFGSSMHEDVYEIGADSKVHLRKIAPRLPLTFYRWLCAPGTDDLEVIEQLGYRAGQYVRAQVPMEKASLFVYRQEGANFTGRALLREMYLHWYVKNNLYRIEAISCERNGMGVPVVTMGKTAGPTYQEDKAAALRWVQQLTTHERLGVVLPPEWLLELKGVTGNLRDPKDAIAHHNTMIAIAGMAQFLLMGQGHSSGNRALGQTMSDFFYLSLQATANYVARVISLTTIKRLVDFNFPGVVNYPKLNPQQILSVNFQDVVEAVKELATDTVDAIRPDDDLEKWIREKIGAPKMGAARVRVAPPTPTPGVEDGVPPAAARVAASEAVQTRRPARGVEKCLALSEIVSRLDSARDEVAAELRKARSRVQAEVVNRLVNTPVKNLHRVSIAPDEKLVAAVEEILRGVAEFGLQQVADELARQRKGAAPADAEKVRAAEGRVRRDQVGLYADGVVSEFQNTLQARATNVASDYLRKPDAQTKGEAIRAIEADLDEQADKWIDGVASKGANEAFAEGRDGGYEEYKDEIGSVVYSALLDINTCPQCAEADGQEGATPDDIPGVPNPDCDGGDKCRCVHVYVFSDEVKSKA